MRVIFTLGLSLLFAVPVSAQAPEPDCAPAAEALDRAGLGVGEFACERIGGRIHYVRAALADGEALSTAQLGWATLRGRRVLAFGVVPLTEVLRGRAIQGDSLRPAIAPVGGWLRVGLVASIGEDFYTAEEHLWMVRVPGNGVWRSGPVLDGDRYHNAMDSCSAHARVELTVRGSVVSWTWHVATAGDGAQVSAADRPHYCSIRPGEAGRARLRSRRLRRSR